MVIGAEEVVDMVRGFVPTVFVIPPLDTDVLSAAV
jgi:hypothetical protein